MGLDQYVLKGQVNKTRNREEVKNKKIWKSLGAIKKDVNIDFADYDGTYALTSEFHYWRKYHVLQDWFTSIYYHNGGGLEFNGDTFVNITKELLDKLEDDVRAGLLKSPEPYFLLDDIDEDENLTVMDAEMKENLEFIEKARKYLEEDEANILVYTSSW